MAFPGRGSSLPRVGAVQLLHTSIRPQLPDTSLRVLEGFEGL